MENDLLSNGRLSVITYTRDESKLFVFFVQNSFWLRISVVIIGIRKTAYFWKFSFLAEIKKYPKTPFLRQIQHQKWVRFIVDLSPF